jgi:hypothetical protein
MSANVVERPLVQPYWFGSQCSTNVCLKNSQTNDSAILAHEEVIDIGRKSFSMLTGGNVLGIGDTRDSFH